MISRYLFKLSIKYWNKYLCGYAYGDSAAGPIGTWINYNERRAGFDKYIFFS